MESNYSFTLRAEIKPLCTDLTTAPATDVVDPLAFVTIWRIASSAWQSSGPQRDDKTVKKERIEKSADCRDIPRGQPASRARSPCRTIDWLQRFKRLEGSAEAFMLTLTNTQTEVPWPYSWHNDDQPVSASSIRSAALCGPVLATMEAATSETKVGKYLTDFAGYYCARLREHAEIPEPHIMEQSRVFHGP